MIAIKDVQIIPSAVNTGQNFTISAKVFDVDWNTIKQDFTNWQDIKNLNNWASSKNYDGVR